MGAGMSDRRKKEKDIFPWDSNMDEFVLAEKNVTVIVRIQS